jgi:uncharacterized protein
MGRMPGVRCRPLLLAILASGFWGCSSSSPRNQASTADGRLLQVEVSTILSGPEESLLVVLASKDGQWMLPIAVGLAEAQSIALELQDYAPMRPMTHDLLKTMVEALGGKVDRVQVDGLKDGAFLATIFLRQGSTEKQVDARPSDAMAIALRCKAPIYVSDRVMSEAGVSASGKSDRDSKDSPVPRIEL